MGCVRFLNYAISLIFMSFENKNILIVLNLYFNYWESNEQLHLQNILIR